MKREIMLQVSLLILALILLVATILLQKPIREENLYEAFSSAPAEPRRPRTGPSPSEEPERPALVPAAETLYSGASRETRYGGR